MGINPREDAAFGLMSLSEMINCRVASLVHLMTELQLQIVMLGVIERGGMVFDVGINDEVDDFTLERMQGFINKIAPPVAEEFEWEIVEKRIERFQRKLNASSFTNADLFYEVKALKDVIEDNLNFQWMYRYPNEKAKILLSWKSDWEIACNCFPEIYADAQAGVDLWALGHNTASVFQMMRVLEIGLGALAASVNVNYSTQTWYNVINEIEKAIRKESQKPKSQEKEKRLQFLSETAKEFSYFKDGWRNYVSHKKCEYDEHQARSVMEHVRQFMTTLAKNLPVSEESDQSPDQIDQNSHLRLVPERSQ